MKPPPILDVLPQLRTGAAYAPSVLHADERIWVEKNCYVDIWIEVLHALELEPLAAMGFTLAIDFDGDQFTFFKPVHKELTELYGLDVQELNVWRPLLDHSLEHLAAGRLVSTEADAYWLPDTAGTDYQRQHTKTSIVLTAIDVAGQRARYFHNAGFHELEGEDFRRLFGRDGGMPSGYRDDMTAPGDAQAADHVDAPADFIRDADRRAVMPLFAELFRFDRCVRHPDAELVARALPILRFHVRRCPESNPIRRFAARLSADLPDIQRRGLAYFHAWAFATIRQLGAAHELSALHLDWLSRHGGPDLTAAAREFELIAHTTKSLILKGARSANSGKPLDASRMFDDMAGAWDRAMDQLRKV